MCASHSGSLRSNEGMLGIFHIARTDMPRRCSMRQKGLALAKAPFCALVRPQFVGAPCALRRPSLLCAVLRCPLEHASLAVNQLSGDLELPRSPSTPNCYSVPLRSNRLILPPPRPTRTAPADLWVRFDRLPWKLDFACAALRGTRAHFPRRLLSPPGIGSAERRKCCGSQRERAALATCSCSFQRLSFDARSSFYGRTIELLIKGDRQRDGLY